MARRRAGVPNRSVCCLPGLQLYPEYPVTFDRIIAQFRPLPCRKVGGTSKRRCRFPRIALGAELKREGLLFHLNLNAYWEPLKLELPNPGAAYSWRRWIDTALDSPRDLVP